MGVLSVAVVVCDYVLTVCQDLINKFRKLAELESRQTDLLMSTISRLIYDLGTF